MRKALFFLIMIFLLNNLVLFYHFFGDEKKVDPEDFSINSEIYSSWQKIEKYDIMPISTNSVISSNKENICSSYSLFSEKILNNNNFWYKEILLSWDTSIPVINNFSVCKLLFFPSQKKIIDIFSNENETFFSMVLGGRLAFITHVLLFNPQSKNIYKKSFSESDEFTGFLTAEYIDKAKKWGVEELYNLFIESYLNWNELILDNNTQSTPVVNFAIKKIYTPYVKSSFFKDRNFKGFVKTNHDVIFNKQNLSSLDPEDRLLVNFLKNKMLYHSSITDGEINQVCHKLFCDYFDNSF